MRIKNFIILIYFFPAVFLWCFDLDLANLYEYSPNGSVFEENNITEDLFESLRRSDREGILSLSRTKSRDIPKSILDTAALSDSENIDFIIYGFLKVTDNYYDFEVKLFDREAGEIKKVFYTKTDRSDYWTLVETMSKRITTYFYKTLGITSRKVEEEKERGVMDIEWGLGYWTPFNPWAESLMGLLAVHVTGSLTPVDPLFNWDIFSFTLGYGLGVDYLPGINKEDFEAYSFHSIRLGFPVTLSGTWYYRNKIILQIAPELQLDILYQDRLYGSAVTEKSAVVSLSTSLGYEYLFTDKRFSLGFFTRFHTAFYTSLLFSIEPSFYFRYRFKPIGNGG